VSGMQLPADSIGISDIIAWRECPRRMSFSMRRHTPAGEPPEATTPNTAFGSAMHDVFEYVGREDAFDDEAVQYGFDRWARWLEPDDLPRMRENLAVYRQREHLGVRTIAVEGEYRVPLVEVDGKMYYFRCKIDRLYQSLADERVFIGVDYKTSRWPKSDAEVHSDVQQWAYNWAIHEVFPECERLVQIYDQLRYGAIPTSKSDAQRAQIKEWLARHVVAILHDEDYGDDGLLLPKLNDWCAYCPLAESCAVVADVTDFALSRIAALAPERKEGRKVVVDLEPERFDTYVATLDDVSRAKKLLERYETAVKAVLHQMPQHRRERYGYGIVEKRVERFPPEALKLAHETLGDDTFYEAIGLTKKAIERIPDPEARAFVEGLAERSIGTTYVTKKAAKNAA
jgi:hypothetical protein